MIKESEEKKILREMGLSLIRQKRNTYYRENVLLGWNMLQYRSADILSVTVFGNVTSQKTMQFAAYYLRTAEDELEDLKSKDGYTDYRVLLITMEGYKKREKDIEELSSRYTVLIPLPEGKTPEEEYKEPTPLTQKKMRDEKWTLYKAKAGVQKMRSRTAEEILLFMAMAGRQREEEWQ